MENKNKKVVVGLISRQRNDGTNQYLLVKSKKDFGEFTGCWYPPGRHTEKGENERQTLIREIKEELNLKIKPVKKITETLGDTKNRVTSWWICRFLAGDLENFKINQTEIPNAGWFTKK